MSKQKSFLLLILTQTLSLIGSRMTSIGVGIYLFKTTGYVTPLMLMTFLMKFQECLGAAWLAFGLIAWTGAKKCSSPTWARLLDPFCSS